MAIYQFKREQLFHYPIDKIWDFISTPINLPKITPDYLNFQIKTTLPEEMYEGMIIIYRVTPLLGIKTTWMTEITHIKPMEYFVDEQRVGPYKLWHHEHFLAQQDDGVLMTDIITYQPPFGVLGELANSIIIRKKLNEIFDYRNQVFDKILTK